jgi:hypothetical protein
MTEKPVYALSGYAEWFWLMAKGWKDVENRNWPLNQFFKPLQFPIRIYLHASKTKASEDELNFISTTLMQEDVKKLTEFLQVDWSKYRGHIIGEITITKQLRKHVPNPQSSIGTGGIFSAADITGEMKYLKQEAPEYFSPWFFGEFGFVVKGGVLYERPIPYRGQLGFFKPVLGEVKHA